MRIHLAKFFASFLIVLPFLMGCNSQLSKTQTGQKNKFVQIQGQSKQTFSEALNPGTPVPQKWAADPNNHIKTSEPHINQSISVPILEYHEANYIPGDIATLKPGEFLSQLKWLHTHGFHTINFGQLYAAMYYGYQLPSRPVLLTFDDGYESVYFKVFPLLKKYHDQATLFIVSNFTHDKPNRTVKFPTLTKSELIEMQSSGLVDIESHTMDHRDLSTLKDSQATWEIQGSADFLEKIVNHKMIVFCYPDGGYTSKTVSIVKNANYLLAVTQHQGYATIAQGPFTLKRISILDYTSLADFAGKLQPSLK